MGQIWNKDEIVQEGFIQLNNMVSRHQTLLQCQQNEGPGHWLQEVGWSSVHQWCWRARRCKFHEQFDVDHHATAKKSIPTLLFPQKIKEIWHLQLLLPISTAAHRNHSIQMHHSFVPQMLYLRPQDMVECWGWSQSIIPTSLSAPLDSIYTSGCIRKGHNIIKNHSHPGHFFFSPSPVRQKM